MGSCEPRRIAILGAGIGGLALAIGLQKQNVPYTLYEAASQFSVIGSGVGLGPNALRAMDGIDSRFRILYDEIKTGNKSAERVNETMDSIPLANIDDTSGGSVGSEDFTRTSAHRKALLDVMVTFVPKEAVRFNKRAIEVSQTGKIVHILFADGEAIVVDTVLGADGIKGVTRKAVLSRRYPESVEPTYSGMYIYRATVPVEAAETYIGHHAGDAKMFMGHSRNVTCYPISKGKETNLVAFVRDDEKTWLHEQWTQKVSKETMLQEFEEADPRIQRMLDEHAQPLRWALFHHPDTPMYYSGSICLLGDAAHATTPHQAAGAGQALEDAFMLSRLLSRVHTSPRDWQIALEAAYQVFDEIRRPYANKVVSTSLEAGSIYNFTHAETGDDMAKIVANANARLPWIWNHDVAAEVILAERKFEELIAAR